MTGSRAWGLRLARAILRRPRDGLAILWARLSGKRLRARQLLLALGGAEHRLNLPSGWQRALEGPLEPLPSGLAVATLVQARATEADVILVKPPDHILVPGAPHALAAAFAADPDLQALYADAVIDGAAGSRAVLRPAFDPDFLTAHDYVGPVVALRRTALDGLAEDARNTADLLLGIHAAFGAGAVRHLPKILSRSPPVAPAAVRDARAPSGTLPRVSLIVPTRDRLDLLRTCVESLLAYTDWPTLEVLIIDNDSRELETLAYLRALEAEQRARVVPWPGPFDFAGMNNAAATAARGDLLAFVNNDVEAFQPNWLRLMAAEALRPEVGAVGAKLLDADGLIQHGGIVLGTGGGMATHAHRFFPGDAPGDLMRLAATHRVSAVTAACLVVEAAKFADVGGFDAENFAVDFNDVDLCLRLEAAGWRTLMVPQAVLHHREAASRRWTPQARARHEGEVARLRARWPERLAGDPHYHPAFDPDLGTYVALRPEPPTDPVPR